jgi:hypothetical protein
MFWTIWTLTMLGGFPWPIFPMFGFALAMGSKLAEYHQKYGGGYEARQRMIQAEIERERSRQMDEYAGKLKNEDALPGIRLTGDGELTDSFIQELEDDYDRR